MYCSGPHFDVLQVGDFVWIGDLPQTGTMPVRALPLCASKRHQAHIMHAFILFCAGKDKSPRGWARRVVALLSPSSIQLEHALPALPPGHAPMRWMWQASVRRPVAMVRSHLEHSCLVPCSSCTGPVA